MNPKEIFSVLQAKKLNPEDAEKNLIEIMEGQLEPPAFFQPSESYKSKNSFIKLTELSQDVNLIVQSPKQPKNLNSSIELTELSESVNLSMQSSDKEEAIAIIGMSGRYPEAKNLDRFWDNILNSKNSIKEVPKSRWDVNKYYDPRPSQKGKVNCKWIGLLDDIEYFDPLFFNISPTEAEAMDPQQRIFLQEAYKAFEDAGYTPESLSSKKCGMYLGIMSSEYGTILNKNYDQVTDIVGNSHSITTGNSYSIAAARASYFLNLKGPAIPIDTACSSSLVATHLACNALKNGEIDMAMVGGVSLYLTSETYIGMCSAGMLSPDGQCKTFDNSANGFVPGEGAGALVLKRLRDAEADNDIIYGVIIGSGINQDGKTNGITAPSMNSQIELEREIYDKYKIDPESISYVEMHGTGTKLGDPIELEALSTVFKEKTDKNNFCAIGSVKTNIGHTSAAAGIASIEKVLLSMKHKKLVPTLNLKNYNEHFDFENSPFYVNTEVKEWKTSSEKPRRACVSTFGFSGTNAHIVLEEYVPNTDENITSSKDNLALIVMSAKSQKQLKAYAQDIKIWVKEHQDIKHTDVAYTLQVGRAAMNYRMAFLTDSRENLLNMLDNFISDDYQAGIFTAKVKKNNNSVTIPGTDDDVKTLMQGGKDRDTLGKILGLWLDGINVDWNKLYTKIKPHRISLPTYPFAKERYWVDLKAEVKKNNIVLNPNVCFMKKQWEYCLSTKSNRKTTQTIAILTTEETKELAIKLSKYFINSEILEENTIRLKLQQPVSNWENYDGFVDLIGCGFEKNNSVDWMLLLQKLIEYGQKDNIMLLCVTKGLESFKNDEINLSGASHAGLYRMLQSEYSNIRSRHVDLESSYDDEILAQWIANEFFYDSEDPEVCYRGGKRYKAYLKEYLDRSENQSVVFPENNVLCITGGTRGIGYLCAQHFVKNYGVKKLVLMGREIIPPREQWDSYEHQSTSIAKKIKRIQALEAEGATVEVLSISLSDETSIQQSLRYIKKTLGPIGGLIHCAGSVDIKNPAWIQKSIDGIHNIIEPKIMGLDT